VIACPLCSGVVWRVAQGDHWSTVLNRDQRLLGKSMLVLNRHSEDVTGLTDHEWLSLRRDLAATKRALDQLLQPDHYNLLFLMNVDRHVHLHIWPRYRSRRTWQGMDYEDPDFGSPCNASPRAMKDEDLEQLRSALHERLR
jgi:diadenosine tetraphosphate (Ap4A) HIT family hydrolase